MYNSILRHVLAPAFELATGTKSLQCLKELEESQWWPRNKILELQNQRLRQLVKQAYENVPYYRRMFEDRALKPDDVECSADLIKLPVLTKQIIRENFDSLTAKNISTRRMREKYTSGSTGEPLRFYAENNEATRSYASSQRAYGWSGYEMGDKCVYIGHTNRFLSTLEKTKQVAKKIFERIKVFDVGAMSTREIPLVAKEIEDFQPQFIRGYPSSIDLLARYIEKEGENTLRLKAIFTLAEKVEDYQRELFRKVFGCETYSLYSATEAPNIASECSSHQGYHITAENMIIEIVDNQGRPVPATREGKILVTNLHNNAMPFIRYEIGDWGAVSEQICSCGRGLPVLMKLEGRISDSIITKSGRPIPGLTLHQHFLGRLEGVVQWQIVQESYEQLSVRLVLDRLYSESHHDKLTSEIRGHYRNILDDEMAITIEFVDQIPLTSTGKRRFVISKVTPEPR